MVHLGMRVVDVACEVEGDVGTQGRDPVCQQL